ncbi:MAG: argininosuccinate lyase, partial [Bacteroidota bacterium]
KDCLLMAQLMLENISVKKNIMQHEKYKYAFSVEAVNKLVLEGLPFRDAYKKVGLIIESGDFEISSDIDHVHEGSIGNLCNDQIQQMMQTVLAKFEFEKVNKAIEKLIKA